MTPEEKKEKARWARIKRVYGITKEQYDAIDPGHCVLCLRHWSNLVRPCVDHDHVSGHIRGIICLYCNHRVVGRHRDSGLLRRVSDYLNPVGFPGYVVPAKPKKKRKRKAKAS